MCRMMYYILLELPLCGGSKEMANLDKPGSDKRCAEHARVGDLRIQLLF
jgi:hypothetical protein